MPVRFGHLLQEYVSKLREIERGHGRSASGDQDSRACASVGARHSQEDPGEFRPHAGTHAAEPARNRRTEAGWVSSRDTHLRELAGAVRYGESVSAGGSIAAAGRDRHLRTQF